MTVVVLAGEPTLLKRTKVEGTEIHWGGETGQSN